ncbi:RagB/SusD family nutrient uptake outer membrane protein [Chitinophaga sp. Mgbs1]|uniref:RagB/SusD family nutrient uptake outer membrane protein n=1 Tax=Chitinophaga solisilvae TaxID=1233460 RepID=A0A9Q5CVM2_9BACT|nr:RagB/SusD family nutrient uptake outer membrane protein [Chitinophaga solisilvae]
MRSFHIVFILLLAAAGISGCNKFLDVKPKGILIPEKLSDYQLMLNSRQLTLTFPPVLLYCTDNYYEEFDDISTVPAANAYYWRPGIDQNEKDNPVAWGDLYNSIYHTNVIINNVMSATDGSPEARAATLAEALVVRADCYFMLLTLFAKAYNPATAASDPGLPLVHSTDVTSKTPPRASLKTTLDTIVTNVTDAIASLPLTNLNKYRPTKNAAYSLLARVYLYMQDYDNCGKYTDLLLAAPHAMLNYNDYEDAYSFPPTDFSPEVIWQRGSLDYEIPGGMGIQHALSDLYESGDLRKEFLTYTLASTPDDYHYFAESGYPNFGTTYQEMYLNKAEVLARKNQPDAAMNMLNQLRKHRFTPAAYKPVTASGQEDALKKVLEERRRELAFRGPRWMDMKRLDREGRMPLVERRVNSTGVLKATLEPGSRKYVFQIPARVQQFNPDIQLNDR